MDSANVALPVLVLGQLVTDKIQPFLIVLGLVLFVGAWLISVQYVKGGEKS